MLTSALVDLVDGEPRRGEHPHVWPELLGQRRDHVTSGGRGRDSDALGAHLLTRVLIVEPVRTARGMSALRYDARF